MNQLALLRKASRMKVLPVMIAPVLIGAAAAYAWTGQVRVWLLLLTLLGAAAAHLFSNMVNDLWDYRSGVDIAAKEEAAAISTNSGVLAEGLIPVRTYAMWTFLLLAFAIGCGVTLAMFSGSAVLLYVAAGTLLAYGYVAPPLRFGYRGKGYSEVAILLSFGILPVMGTYYVMTGEHDWRALLVSLPVGLLTTLVLFNHHFLHWRADAAAGKRTLVVVLGERSALKVSVMLLGLALASILLGVSFGALPWYGLAALIVALPFIPIYRGLLSAVNPPPEAFLPLMGTSLKAVLRCGIILLLSLIVMRLFIS